MGTLGITSATWIAKVEYTPKLKKQLLSLQCGVSVSICPFRLGVMGEMVYSSSILISLSTAGLGLITNGTRPTGGYGGNGILLSILISLSTAGTCSMRDGCSAFRLGVMGENVCSKSIPLSLSTAGNVGAAGEYRCTTKNFITGGRHQKTAVRLQVPDSRA